MTTYSRQTNRNQFKFLIAGILVVWFWLALRGSWLGVFASPQRPPLLLGAAAGLPVLLFVGWYLSSNDFRQFLLGLDLRFLASLQTGRLGGLLFLLLYLFGLLPGMFAIPAGWGDIAIGAIAPVAASAIVPGRNFNKGFFVWWNLLGMLDLVLAVTLGVFASGAFPGLSPGAVTTEVMGRFPLSLVPTFFVPLYLILHLISLSRVPSLQSVTTQRV